MTAFQKKEMSHTGQCWGVSLLRVLWSDRDSFLFSSFTDFIAKVNHVSVHRTTALDTIWEPEHVLGWGPLRAVHELALCHP